MANLDVTELLADPDMANDFVVVRTGVVMSASGEAIETPQQFYTYGVVGPASGQTLQLLPDEARTTASIRVITPFRLVPATDTTEADMILWDQRYWRVTLLSPFNNWGEGFVDATCTLTSYTMPTPRSDPGHTI